jgi:tetratricopeptide (TPR) repeat protein
MKNGRPVLSAILRLMTLSALLLNQSARVLAQDKFDYEAERKLAFRLVEENKFPDALPILEKLAAANSDDAVVLERLALTLVVIASSSKKAPDQIKKDLIRARSVAQKAKEMGNNSQMVEMILAQIPADPAAMSTSERKRSPAEEALMDGEGAFSRGDYNKAIEHYENAAKLDPKLYDAPLFIGDVYYKTNKIDKAGEAYTRAIAVDPDRETAYRYWGNVLMTAGKMKEAKEKFIEAIIAEPYNRAPWQFLSTWARRNQIQLGHPRIEIPTSSVQKKDDKNISVTLNPTGKKDGSEAWATYSITRAAWMNEVKISKEFPDDKKYRHSLREESAALRLTAESVLTQMKEGKLKEDALNVSIANLLKLHRAGLTEAYILLAMPDEGIAQDYAEYRKNNRDKLRQYLIEHVTAAK